MRPISSRAGFALTCLLLASLSGVAVADIGKVPGGLDDLNVKGSDLWIYNDLPSAMAEAKRTNKPLFVTFRCVPCSACKGFDAEVAKGNEAVHKLARDKFVSVRQVEMKHVDLSLFQFDYDLNWAAVFINADGTVYARYGTQSAEGPDAYNSMKSLEACMKRVLALHEAYPRNKAELAGKRGKPKPYKTALEMPGLPNKDRYRGTTTRRNCVHCHNIHDAEQEQWNDAGTFSVEKLYRYPLPDSVGIKIDRHDGRRVESVKPGSPAARAGIKPGSHVAMVNGQPITSIADIQWVLHHLPLGDAQATFTMASGTGTVKDHVVRMTKGWKKADFTWRGSMWALKPRPGYWAPALDEGQKKNLRLPVENTAFRIKWLNRNSPEGKVAFNAGLREGDVIVGLEGKPIKMTPREYHRYYRLNYRGKPHVNVVVLRRGKRVNVRVPTVQ